jgi:alkanesulfonate monooxygenase SsuD/methylene tetrahydromethanopterin reductase-like flavin-dependent oxidoreductase (luciferase family)
MPDTKFGILMGGTWTQGLPSGSELLAMARGAEEAGYDSIHTSDHISSPPEGLAPSINAFPFLAAAAAVTERVKLGPYPLAMPLYNASIVGSMMLSIHHISNGRAIFCTASGFGYPVELEAVNVALPERPMRNTEGMDLVAKLWTEDNVSFEGEFNKTTNLNMTIRRSVPNSIPTWVNGRHDSALRRAVSSGEAWAVPMVTPQEFAEKRPLVQQYAEESSRDLRSGFDWVVEVGFNLNADRGRATAEAEAAVELRPDKQSTTGQAPTEDLVGQAAALGSPEECISKVREFVDSGATWIIATPLCPLSGFQDQMLQFAKHVIPSFKAVKAGV